MDGTFDSCPPFFDQLYVIHGIEFGRQFSCVFALLPRRKRNTYVKLLRYIKDNAIRLNTVFNPTRIMSDFESGLKAAIVVEQAVYRRIQNLGLSTSYNSNDTIRSYCRRITALPFLPINVVVNTFNELQDETPLAIRKNLQPLYDYFNNYWLNTIDLEKWNVYGLEHRTNNICEGWHNRFSQRVQKHHPHIWHFTDVLKKEFKFGHDRIQLLAGAPMKNPRQKTTAVQKRITTLTRHYEAQQLNEMEFLLAILFALSKSKNG
ncbi:unnamed protein product [Didymodactylos carnosus]|uniref:MULE transposase domain-containing protein n=2 Tax=Didymodactylos carnosus TaxID=1234261 RepID=A0A8S2CX24_9BILA|nr:unnamed protein product [Didymodactylos carnosus]CAF3577102.1 unnamed protein product [Didymodactylos carnosus]